MMGAVYQHYAGDMMFILLFFCSFVTMQQHNSLTGIYAKQFSGKDFESTEKADHSKFLDLKQYSKIKSHNLNRYIVFI